MAAECLREGIECHIQNDNRHFHQPRLRLMTASVTLGLDCHVSVQKEKSMNVVGSEWSDVASGYRLLTEKNTRLCQQWMGAIDDTRADHFARNRASWNDMILRERERGRVTRRWCVAGVPIGVLVLILGITVQASVLVLLSVAIVTSVVAVRYRHTTRYAALARREPSLDRLPTLSVDIVAEWWTKIGASAWMQRDGVDGDIGEV